MHLPVPRGPLSGLVLEALLTGADLQDDTFVTEVARSAAESDVLLDGDFQLALWVAYELHYRGFDDVPDREWDPGLLRLRAEMERAFESTLVAQAGPLVEAAKDAAHDVPAQIEHVIGQVDGPSVAQHIHRAATHEQFVEFMQVRSIYTLKESDHTSFLLPRLDGPAKAALAELQYDEYGGGRPERLHATLFARALVGCGLDPAYGAFIDNTPGHVLAENNAMSLVTLHRRLRGAGLGHLAAFEATSSLPCRWIGMGVRRLGLPDSVWEYFDEHVEADAVHEQLALRDICGASVADDPTIRDDVLLGAAVCVQLADASNAATLSDWEAA